MSHSKLKANSMVRLRKLRSTRFSSLDSESLTLVRSELQALNDRYDGKAFQLNNLMADPFGDLLTLSSERFCRNT